MELNSHGHSSHYTYFFLGALFGFPPGWVVGQVSHGANEENRGLTGGRGFLGCRHIGESQTENSSLFDAKFLLGALIGFPWGRVVG